MGWPDSPTAVLALRTLLYDGPVDKYAANKKVLGVCDGINLNFKTFEYRRTTTFTAASAIYPVGLFINGQQIPPASIGFDDPISGFFSIAATASTAVIPNNRNAFTASYYYQWFNDAELDSFLQNATTWLGFNTTYINIPLGLNAAALRFAAQEAYLAAAMRYSTRMSEIYQLEDAPKEDILKAIDAFKSMADDFLSKAEKMRDDFYTRQGQSLAPNFAFSLGQVTDPTPRR